MDEQEKADEAPLYHERQVKELCALHVLNNLFQTNQTFTKKELDDICNKLSPDAFINPHRSVLGLGNYDINVLMAALQKKGYETIWFDKRKDVDILVLDKVMGLILNTPSELRLGFIKLPIHRKHWIAIKFLQGQYMNLDSKLDSPQPIGDRASLIAFLRSEMSEGDKELFLVVEPEVYEKGLWQKKKDEKKNSAELEGKNSSGSTGTDKNDTDNMVVQSVKSDCADIVQNGIDDIGSCAASN